MPVHLLLMRPTTMRSCVTPLRAAPCVADGSYSLILPRTEHVIAAAMVVLGIVLMLAVRPPKLPPEIAANRRVSRGYVNPALTQEITVDVNNLPRRTRPSHE